METQDVTNVEAIAKECLLGLIKELKCQEVSVLPMAPGTHEPVIYKENECANAYPRIRCDIPGCGPTALLFDNSFFVVCTLSDQFLTENSWEKLVTKYLEPIYQGLARMVVDNCDNSYIIYAALGTNSNNGSRVFTATADNISLRVTAGYDSRAQGMKLKVETLGSSVSRA